MPTVLALSPHLDDAIFSAGGTLARMAGEGWRVIVATIFTASVPDPAGFALACQLDKGLDASVDYMALRRAEDSEACRHICAEAIWLPHAEAPHRGYTSAKDLFDGLHADDPIVGELIPTLTELIGTVAADEIFAPQAIGAHVDHEALYLALARCECSPMLWADFPYAARTALRASPFAARIAEGETSEIRLDAAELELKTRAVVSYASQLGFQFGGVAAAEQAVQNDGSLERFVRLPKETSRAVRLS